VALHAWEDLVEKLQDLSLWAAVRLARTTADDEGGQTLIEYGLMAALIAIVAVSAVALVGQKLPDLRPAADNLHS
jgi:Flp pilus assembly pilin Flp